MTPWRDLNIEIGDELVMQWTNGAPWEPNVRVVFTEQDGAPFVVDLPVHTMGPIFPLIDGDMVVEHKKARRQ